MPEFSPMPVPASYLAVFVEHLTLDEDQRARLLEETGIDADALRGGPAVIPLARVLSALCEIDRQATPGWHIEPSLSLEATHHGPLGIAIVTAPTVAQALDSLVRYESIRAPWTVLSRHHGADRLTLRVMPMITLDGPAELLMEINLIALAGIVARVLGRPDDLQIIFPERERPHDSLLREWLPGQCRFAGPHHALSLPTECLAKPCLLADQELNASARRRCEALLARAGGDGRLAAQIRQDLMTAGGRAPNIETIAARYNQSTRSLIRHLGNDRTSYRTLVQEVRSSIARDLLLNSDLAVSSIANQLGYSDPANFGRAFRRWFGVSPGQARRSQAPIESRSSGEGESCQGSR